MPSTTGSPAFPNVGQFQEDIPEKYRPHLQRDLIIGIPDDQVGQAPQAACPRQAGVDASWRRRWRRRSGLRKIASRRRWRRWCRLRVIARPWPHRPRLDHIAARQGHQNSQCAQDRGDPGNSKAVLCLFHGNLLWRHHQIRYPILVANRRNGGKRQIRIGAPALLFFIVDDGSIPRSPHESVSLLIS